jgi:hypothetical protein
MYLTGHLRPARRASREEIHPGIGS